MVDSLYERIAAYRSVSIIGMCKNAGKTTALNGLIREAAQRNRILGLTSIGRDGEDKDLVTGTKKPGIYVPEGTLVATAAQLALRSCDVSREILDTTGMFTPMGEVILLRAKSDGNVQLAGPSMTSQLAALREAFFRLGADQVLIDGALSRKSLCSRHVTEATILCTGASYHRDLNTVVEDTAFQCRILALPENGDAAIRALAAEDHRQTVLLTLEGPYALGVGEKLEDALRKFPARAVFFGGALTDSVMKPLLMSSVSLQDVEIVVRDSSKILMKQDVFEKLQRRGARLQVIDNVNLAAMTVNPFSAYGFHFDPQALFDTMQARVEIPVFNVMEGGSPWN